MDVNTDDLRIDAKGWVEAANRLDVLKEAAAQDATIDGATDVTTWGVGAAREYDKARMRVVGLCRLIQHKCWYDSIPENLREAATLYDEVDKGNAKALKAVEQWD